MESTCCFNDSWESSFTRRSWTQASGAIINIASRHLDVPNLCGCCGEPSQMNCVYQLSKAVRRLTTVGDNSRTALLTHLRNWPAGNLRSISVMSLLILELNAAVTRWFVMGITVWKCAIDSREHWYWGGQNHTIRYIEASLLTTNGSNT